MIRATEYDLGMLMSCCHVHGWQNCSTLTAKLSFKFKRTAGASYCDESRPRVTVPVAPRLSLVRAGPQYFRSVSLSARLRALVHSNHS
jgi:hypothetical protein